MRYAGLLKNDVAAAPGVSVSFWTQGCPHRCSGCHNPETWDPKGGKEFTAQVLDEIIEALRANGIKRNLSILGGEPLSPENEFLTYLVIKTVKEKLPDTEIYLWTGYVYEDLKRNTRPHLGLILEQVDVLIDGPYIEAKRDITLPLRGSSNQRIIYLKEKEND